MCRGPGLGVKGDVYEDVFINDVVVFPIVLPCDESHHQVQVTVARGKRGHKLTRLCNKKLFEFLEMNYKDYKLLRKDQ